jgi:hypothetical protein
MAVVAVNSQVSLAIACDIADAVPEIHIVLLGPPEQLNEKTAVTGKLEGLLKRTSSVTIVPPAFFEDALPPLYVLNRLACGLGLLHARELDCSAFRLRGDIDSGAEEIVGHTLSEGTKSQHLDAAEHGARACVIVSALLANISNNPALSRAQFLNLLSAIDAALAPMEPAILYRGRMGMEVLFIFDTPTSAMQALSRLAKIPSSNVASGEAVNEIDFRFAADFLPLEISLDPVNRRLEPVSPAIETVRTLARRAPHSGIYATEIFVAEAALSGAPYISAQFVEQWRCASAGRDVVTYALRI